MSLSPGDVRKGYEYIGGDPSDRNNWRKVGEGNRSAVRSDAELFGAYKQEKVEYGGFREGLATFLEGAVGAGDELDALYARMTGEADSWDEAIDDTRARMKAFAKDNENLATTLDWGGMAAGFLVPGATVVKTAKGLSAAQKTKRGIKYGVGEGAVYGFLSGEETEGRVAGLALGGTVGGVAGVLAPRLLDKNAAEISRIDFEESQRVTGGEGGHIWGGEGVGQTVRAMKGKTSSGDQSTSVKGRKVRQVNRVGDVNVQKDTYMTKLGEVIDATALGTREWLTKHGNARAARLLTDSELMIKQSAREIDDIFENELTNAMRVVDGNTDAKTQLLNIGEKADDGRQLFSDPSLQRTSPKGRVVMDDLSRFGKSPSEKQELSKLQSLYEEVIANDLQGFAKKGKEYFPRLAKGKISNAKNASIAQYESPVIALKELAKDVNAARVLAHRFGLTPDEVAKIKPKKKEKGTITRVEAVIKAIENKAQKELAGKGSSESARVAAENAANNLGVALRSSLVYSKQGADATGSILRKLTSTGLLANFSNAMLNVVEGISLPLYQSGFRAWMSTIVPGLKNTVMRKAAADDPNWISTHEFGLDRQYMGEVQAETRDGVAKLVDNVGSFFYKWSGVQTVNEMGQEMATNTAFKRGVELARKGDIEKLRELPGMRGLNEREVRETAAALKRGDGTSPYVRMFAGNTLADVQPVLASAMPKAFNENPNGRMFYSMLTYMNRQYNRIRTDIGLELAAAQKVGMNTKEGQAHLKKASVNTAKYVTLVGMVNGVWDDFRKSVFNADDREALFGDGEIRGAEIRDIEDMLGYIGETTSNQLTSNLSSGMVNQRAQEFGGNTVSAMPAPLDATFKAGGGLFDVLFEQDPTKLARFGQSYVPGLSQMDKVSRATTGNRLFEDLGVLD